MKDDKISEINNEVKLEFPDTSEQQTNKLVV